MSGSQFQFALVFRADTAAGKAGLTDLASTFKQVSTAGETVSATARKQTTDLTALAAATAKAISGQDQLAAAEKRAADARAKSLIAPLAMPAVSMAPLQAAFKATETTAGGVRGAVNGLTTDLTLQTREALETAAASRTYRAALDDIRASFNPLFAASRAYEQQLDRIAEAEKLGAISAREAAAARVAAAERMMPITPAAPGRVGAGATGSSAYTANIGAQGFDVGVTAAMGMNPMMIGLQQGTQLAGIAQQMGGGTKAALAMARGMMSIFNWTTLLTVVLTALAAVGIQALMGLKEETKTWDEHLGELNDRLGRMKTGLERISNIRLSETFGNLTADVRGLTEQLLELDRAAELRSLKGVADNFLSANIDPSWWQAGGMLTPNSWSLNAYSNALGGSAADREADAIRSEKYAELGAANSFEDFEERRARIGELAKSGDVKAVTAELTDLYKAMRGDGSAEMSDELLELMAQLAEAGVKTAEIEAMLNGSARAEAQKRQTDQIVRGYRQEADLQLASLQFGEDSVEVERLKADQARELLAIRLEEAGIQKGSADWQRAMLALADQQAASEAAASEARKERARDQADEIAAINREIALIGASNAARLRANALAEADIEIRKRKLAGQEAEAERANAIAKAEAQARLDHAQAMQGTLKASVLDIYDARIADERDPMLRAAIEGERAYAAVLLETGNAEEAAAEAARVRTKALADAGRERRKALEDIAQTGLMNGYDAQIAAARDPYTRAAIEAEKEYARVLHETRDAQQAARSAEVVRAKSLADLAQAQADYLRVQEEGLRQLHLELALVGQTEEVRARVLALAKAEQDIARLGLQGQDADLARRNAIATAAATRELEAQADAWERVQSAGENALDAVLDRLRAGDTKGALREFLGEIEQGFFDLAIRNPLKNAIFGSNLGTLDDVGGLSGIWGRLTGRNRIDEQALAATAVTPLQSMAVTAANVTIGGVGVQSFLSGMNGTAGNLTGGFGGAAFGGLPGSGDVQSTMWQFFAGKGLQPHQVAAIMGHASAESGFDPFAVGDGGNAFGLFQWNDRRHKLFDFIGGKQNLGDVNAQLEFAWQELMTSESGPMARLMASTNLYDATHAFSGFERMSGYNPNNPQSAMHWDQRLAAAEAAMAKFEGQVTATVPAMGMLDAGAQTAGQTMQGIGSQLGGLLQGIGAQHGPLGSFVGDLLGGWISGIGFERGGWTGSGAPSDVAGVVHAEEYVFDAAATRRIGVGNLEALRKGVLRGYQAGGYVVGRAPAMSDAMAGGAPMSQAAAGRSEPAVFNINVTGTGDRELQQGVNRAIAQAFDLYGRDVLPTEVRSIVNDRWSA